MSLLLAFISGILFCSYILPLLDCGLEAVSAIKSVFVTDKAALVNKAQLEITKAQNDADQSPCSAIGFQLPSDEDAFGDEDVGNRFGRKIGF